MKYAAVVLAALAAAVNAVQFTNSVIDLSLASLSSLPDTLVSGATGDSATITLNPADYPSGTYAFEIVDSSAVPNYSEQFTFQGTGSASQIPSATGSTARPTTTAPTTSSETSSEASSETDSTTQTSSKTTTARPTKTTSTDDEEETSVPGAAGRVASPLALVLVTVAAMFYLN
ncbi:unnamed protein product [Parascedosporium putredinis]|uniref:Extracellular matrix protein n=1 Tax=Parascedosporium putredinis TaxID=1442378 RepID=A0A9P1H6F2_9PEZI|nr:unnamed protein product [Parascedosporium putredinis]CAI7997566.1 unnamed protein product [Parascedosporium putredinis]